MCKVLGYCEGECGLGEGKEGCVEVRGKSYICYISDGNFSHFFRAVPCTIQTILTLSTESARTVLIPLALGHLEVPNGVSHCWEMGWRAGYQCYSIIEEAPPWLCTLDLASLLVWSSCLQLTLLS